METQIKLLRVLEDRKITRVGTNEEHEVNVRLVAATNADLKAMVDKKTFRSDLYYRLNVVSIHLPPLRDRRSDIPLLMEHFRKEICARMRKEVVGFTKAARQALIAYDWPGNIRQLRNTVERMIVLDSDSQLDVDDLPDEIAVLAHRDGEAPGVACDPGQRLAHRPPARSTSRRTTSTARWSSPRASAKRPPNCWASASARSTAKSKSTASRIIELPTGSLDASPLPAG